MIIHPFKILEETRAFFVGPPLKEGPLPTLVYFALSAEDSLQRNPFNQPIQFLDGLSLRVFSMTLPGHENGLPPENALDAWEKRMENGDPVIPSFVDSVKETLDYLQPYIQQEKLAVAGLSRGAYIACHLAASYPKISTILGFAPLTRFRNARHLDLETLVPSLYNRAIRFYIGNHDTRVHTKQAFSLISKLAVEAYKNRIRSSPIELLIGPSIGYQGHGTAPEVFKSGAEWIKGIFSL